MIAALAGDNARAMTRAMLRIAIPLLAATLAACTPFESLWKKPKPADEASAAAPTPPPLPLAEATHRFLIAPDQDVIGHVQVTHARHEDTFADLARRFNVGYTELLRANPGVDPWLPGEGTEIILPTEYILPDAPREGLVLNLAQMRLYYFPKPAKGAPKDAAVEVITHPIELPVADTDGAFANFDDITYGKGGAVLKQLARYLGPETFRRGVSAYLKQHAWGNTELADFMGAQARASGRNLDQWTQEWLYTAGVNTLVAERSCSNGRRVCAGSHSDVTSA